MTDSFVNSQSSSFVNSQSQLPWIEKYRPAELKDIISHEQKIKVLKRLSENRDLPHLLFSGQPGTGKTSTILALAQHMYGKNYKRYILELNASDQRGIDTVRQEIPKFTRIKSNDMRLVILDEVDAMTTDAQAALRRVMEEYSKNCRFCLICNNKNKIILGLQSRCAPMRFGVLDRDSIREKLDQIIKIEDIRIEPKALDHLLNIHRDFRQILNTLQCLHAITLDDDIISEQDVVEYLGKPTDEQISNLLHSLSHEPYTKAYQRLLKLHRQNTINIEDLIQAFTDHLTQLDLSKHPSKNTPPSPLPHLTEQQRHQLINGLAQVEYRTITGHDTEIQLASLVSIWTATTNPLSK